MIKNKKELADSKAKKYMIELLEAGIGTVMPGNVIKNQVFLKENKLIIKNKRFNLKKFKRTFVIGFGKASSDMALALEKILKSRITGGIVIATKMLKLKRMKLIKGDHPVPSQANINGAKKIVNLISGLKKDDLVICLISGGGSAIFTLPAPGISLDDMKKMTSLLLKSGAKIQEMNVVRKHMSSVKGGQLAEKAEKATMISLLLSDVIGDDLDIIASGPTVADRSTFRTAYNIMKKHGLLNKAPKSIINHINKGLKKEIKDTPKRLPETVCNILIGNNRLALEGVCAMARRLVLNPKIVSSHVTGEARAAGRKIAGMMKTMKHKEVRVFGGETTVTVKGHGIGGRNQEVVLSAVEIIRGLKDVAFASCSTDGIDFYKAAGAIIDGNSFDKCRKAGLDPESYLKDNNAFPILRKIKALIFTGYTGTNVCDIIIALRL
jgi:glycerate 2-kinase